VLAACQSGSSSAPVASPSPTATSAGGAQAPATGTLRDARALVRGGPSAMTLGCRVHAYAGPFRLERSG
jgi:hypothetical protein